MTCDLITLNTTEDSKKKKKKASRKHSIILQKNKNLQRYETIHQSWLPWCVGWIPSLNLHVSLGFWDLYIFDLLNFDYETKSVSSYAYTKPRHVNYSVRGTRNPCQSRTKKAYNLIHNVNIHDQWENNLCTIRPNP